jgi:hypothetical protein
MDEFIMERYYPALLIILFVLLFSITAIAGGDSTGVDSVGINKETALARALEYTGFGEFAGVSKAEPKIESVILSDDKTPFLHDRINGRPIWQISFSNISINSRMFDSAGKRGDLRKFDVYLDPETGQLLKIISKFEGVDTNFAPEPPIEVAEMQLRNSGELYIDFPPGPTPINFIKAIDPCNDTSHEISASLVIFSRKPRFMEPTAVWAITKRGVGPFFILPMFKALVPFLFRYI